MQRTTASDLANVDVELHAKGVRPHSPLPLPLSLFGENDVRVPKFWGTIRLVPLSDSHNEVVRGKDVIIQGA